ncbi:hypothetical protein CMK12_11890, partial [Candidatus Poribacteria bacterium]|nr:hypothetical protein [Candidatus Poribacteria bacterium]
LQVHHDRGRGRVEKLLPYQHLGPADGFLWSTFLLTFQSTAYRFFNAPVPSACTFTDMRSNQ